MDDGGNYDNNDNDNSRIFNPRLPVVIPRGRVPTIVVARGHIAIPFQILILLTTLGSVAVGTLAASLWPWEYQGKKSNIGDLSNATADPVATTAEVTRIELGGSILTTAKPVAAEPVTTDMATSGPATNAPAGAEPVRIEPPAPAVRDACQTSLAGPQLVLNSPRTVLRSDEPASLGLTVDGASDGAQLIICGFAANSVFSVGQAVDENAWAVPVSMIANATIMPPRGFVGRMDLAVTLMNTDKSLADRKTVYLQWLPLARPGPRGPTYSLRNDFADADQLLTYAAYLKGVGNLLEARQVFARVAGMGDPRGAFMLAETYDPISLAKRQLLPADSDLEQARIWYRKATDLGSPEAPGRLERLATW